MLYRWMIPAPKENASVIKVYLYNMFKIQHF